MYKILQSIFGTTRTACSLHCWKKRFSNCPWQSDCCFLCIRFHLLLAENMKLPLAITKYTNKCLWKSEVWLKRRGSCQPPRCLQQSNESLPAASIKVSATVRTLSQMTQQDSCTECCCPLEHHCQDTNSLRPDFGCWRILIYCLPKLFYNLEGGIYTNVWLGHASISCLHWTGFSLLTKCFSAI